MTDISLIPQNRISNLETDIQSINQNITNLQTFTNNLQSAINQISTTINGISDYIIDYGYDGNRWYRKYKSGFIEQGGNVIQNTNNANERMITFLTSFNSTSYIPIVTVYNNSGSWIYGWIKWDTRTQNNFIYFTAGSRAGDTANGCYWYASGY